VEKTTAVIAFLIIYYPTWPLAALWCWMVWCASSWLIAYGIKLIAYGINGFRGESLDVLHIRL
jgi:hypothetical protein